MVDQCRVFYFLIIPGKEYFYTCYYCSFRPYRATVQTFAKQLRLKYWQTYFSPKKIFNMPVLTAAGCSNAAACPVTPLPSASANCSPVTSVGGVNDVYIIPCDQIMTEVNLLDTAWWTTLTTGSPSLLSQFGRGLGSIQKKNVKTERISSCEVESVISASWALKYILKTFDKSVSKVTNAQITSLIASASRYLAIARMCDGDDTVLPIGKFTVSDFDWIVPDNFEESQQVVIELSWFELAMPKVYTVTGLSAILPKS